MTPPYPIMLHLDRRDVLLVGAGDVGLRKAAGLLEAGARVTAVSTAFSPEFLALPLERITEPYAPHHLALHPFTLVFAATSDPAVNARIRDDAAACNLLCCRCDAAADSDFAGAATARVGGITIAVSTASGSPTIAAQVRDRLAAALDPAWPLLAQLLPAWRARAQQEITDPAARLRLLRHLASDEMLALARSHGAPAAAAHFESLLAAARSP
ncbi:MAG TPA: bifunctional precorrin-2 dehydrogenase/sirohydrochlorin ferrochelatase [Phycisphaerae bacterium]|nr:bifunctional precorrin-2 dehydrogenase/sirohydrochlorin ferrochelatase [Phycisphaerae bacterium]